MPTLRDYLRIKDIHQPLSAQGCFDALHTVMTGLRDHPGITSFDVVSKELQHNAEALETVLEGGIWLPHLRSTNVHGIIVAGGSWPQPIELLLPNKEPKKIRILVLILAHQGLVNEYLAAVGELARRMASPGTIERMATAASASIWAAALLGHALPEASIKNNAPGALPTATIQQPGLGPV